MNPILRKLHLDGNKYITSDSIKRYCRNFNSNYDNTVRNLISRGHLVRIFKGTFYLKTFDEVKLGTVDPSHFDLVSKGLEMKGITNWYFGLNTALKFNNATHEHFTLNYVINDKILRTKPIKINGYRYKFVKLTNRLFGFGIHTNKYRYSDIEKTILDFIYLWRYNGVPDEKILMDVSEYVDHISLEKISKYSVHYPKSVRKMLEDII